MYSEIQKRFFWRFPKRREYPCFKKKSDGEPGGSIRKPSEELEIEEQITSTSGRPEIKNTLAPLREIVLPPPLPEKEEEYEKTDSTKEKEEYKKKPIIESKAEAIAVLISSLQNPAKNVIGDLVIRHNNKKK